MASLLNVGISGLNAAQAGLVTTGHNISNAGTPGFNRQGIVQSNQIPVFSGSGFFGTGTQVDNVRRIYSQYLENQVLSADTRRAELETYSSQIAALDNMLADPDAGLSTGLEAFFKGVQEVAANPASVAARQSLISSAQALTGRFASINNRIEEVRAGNETVIAGAATEISTFAQQIADINNRIVIAQAGTDGQQPNDLLDQRNQLLRELNQIVRISTLEESNGSLSVFVGSGQPLVVGGQASTIITTPSAEDPTRLALAIDLPAGGQIVFPDRVLTGGQLGGALAFRRETLDTAQNQLGLIAAGVAEHFNNQHRLGQDLDGAFGLDFFTGVAPSVNALAGATSAVSVGFGAAENLTGDDYLLTVNSAAATGYVLTRESDGAQVTAADVGLTVTLGATVDGDQFMVRPTRHAARDIAVGINDTRLVAAAGPVLGDATLSNAGTGTISNVKAVSIAGMDGIPADNKPDFSTITLTYDNSAGGRLVVPAGFTPSPLPYNTGTESAGKDFTLTSPAGFVISFRFSGVPTTGDTFTLSPNRNGAGIGVSDNRNMVELGNLQLGKSMLTRRDGSGVPIAGQQTASFQSVYSQLVASVGSKAREVSVGEEAQTRLLEQANEAKEGVSGVNLDEEAANLVRFQQAYQASGRVMQIASRLFDEILALGR